jgi:hypothetical protein
LLLLLLRFGSVPPYRVLLPTQPIIASRFFFQTGRNTLLITFCGQFAVEKRHEAISLSQRIKIYRHQANHQSKMSGQKGTNEEEEEVVTYDGSNKLRMRSKFDHSDTPTSESTHLTTPIASTSSGSNAREGIYIHSTTVLSTHADELSSLFSTFLTNHSLLFVLSCSVTKTIND